MNVPHMKDLIAASKWADLESVWMQALQEPVAPAEAAGILAATAAAGKGELAQTLAWALLAERTESLPPAEALALASCVLLAAPANDELRKQGVEVYRKTHGSHPHFAALLQASGLGTTQSPRRALRTLDVCLALKEGAYLANRFDGKVLRMKAFNAAIGEFELEGPGGSTLRMDPKNLADEFDPVSENDFRVLAQHRPDALGQMLQGDLAGVLIGLCTMHGGQIDSAALKDLLVPRFLAAGAWADWWSKARTAAKKCVNLSLEGRNPVVVTYHAGGLTLEQELAAQVSSAKTPLEKLAILQQYIRESRSRKVAIDAAFCQPLLADLAKQVETFRDNRPADALAAALALEEAKTLGLDAKTAAGASAKDIVTGLDNPAQAVAELADTAVWPGALAALQARTDAPKHLEKLLGFVPANHVDDVAAALLAANAQSTVDQAAADAVADPFHHLDLFIWLWRGPQQGPQNAPKKVELLSRLLKTMLEIEHDWNIPPSVRKECNAKLRAALSASDYGSFKQALGQMDEAVAGTIKRLIERAGGLSDSVRGKMIDLLRENFFGLFVKARIEPWADDSILWTTEGALHARQDELKQLTEVKMLENARAIGAAAAHGDLSENSEWKFALEERDMLRARAAKMQDELALARVLRKENVPTETVGVGSRVHLKRASDGAEISLTFLGPWESDPNSGVYSYQTALAQELMGRIVDDRLPLKIRDVEDEYTIVRLGSGVK